MTALHPAIQAEPHGTPAALPSGPDNSLGLQD